MKSKFITDPQDAADGFLDTLEAEFYTSFSPLAAAQGPGAVPLATNPVEIPSTPALTSEAAEALGSQSGPTSTVSMTSGGITINLLFDAAAMAAPASFRAGIQQAASLLTAAISDQITVNIKIDYSGTGGGAAAGPDNGLYESYSSVRADLVNYATPGDPTFNALPGGSSIQGQSSVAVWNAQLKLWGLLGANDTTTDDGSATFTTDINPSLLVGVALHELTHAMGRVPYGSPYSSSPDIFDLFRFTSPGTLLIDGRNPSAANPVPAAYFSVDGGNTKLADFGEISDPSDFLNSGVQGANDPFNEFYNGGTRQTLTAIDKEQLDALGFHTSVPLNGIVVASNTAEALQGGPRVTLLSAAPSIVDAGVSTLTSATIRIANGGGSAVAGDQLYVNGVQNGSVGSGVTASWNAGTDTLTLTGSATLAVYSMLLGEVGYADTGTDASSGSHPARTVTWSINDGTKSYSTTSVVTVDRLPVANSDATSDAVGTTLTATAATGLLSNDTDLDRDTLNIIGISDAAHGAGSVGVSLAGVYGHLTLNADGSYSYGADNSSAISSAPTGYHLQDAFSYTIGDGNGGTAAATLTITLDRLPVVTAANVTLSAGQASVSATSLFTASDPDGNAITTYGVSDTGNGHFVLNGVVQANNQEIDLTASQLSQLTYQFALGSADTLEIRVNDGQLWSTWTNFVVTAPPLVVQTDGSTSLVENASNFFLDSISTGTGPQLKAAGSPIVAGPTGSWTPIGAVQTGSGYDVAWKMPGGNEYIIWSTDSSGNYTGTIADTSGSSATLESFETIFYQDLNGDGVIGPPATVIEAFGSTKLVEVGSNYFLDTIGSGTGPELTVAGSPVVAGPAGSWAPIAAEQTGSGYDVAWTMPGGNEYIIWKTGSNGNYTGSIADTSGSSATLESFETIFHQDLNGDGVIGAPAPVTTVIEALGSTKLVEVGSNYFLDSIGSGTGPELTVAGSPVVAGPAGSWAPIAAEQTGSGYDVAWKATGGNEYIIWSTDSNGNYTGSIADTSGSSATLESFETIFHQDLNGDGVIGPPAPVTTVIEALGSTKLVEVGSNYFLDSIGSGTGPELTVAGQPIVAGPAGSWAPIAAEQTGSGYDVAWKVAGGNEYIIWSTDSNGNYTGTIADTSGSSATLESFETIFHQDLNGDGVIGIPPATSPASVQSAAQSGTTFGGKDLVLDNSFGGPIIGFTGDGTLAGSDHIDLRGVNYTSLHVGFDGATGTLALSDGSTTANLQFLGHYSPDNFRFADDGNDGTIVYGNSATGQAGGVPSQITSANPGVSVAIGENDAFVFAPNFGQVALTNFDSATDTILFSKSVFANAAALLAATHDDPTGNAVITDAAHDTITIQHVTTAQLLAHQNDLHIV